MMTTVAALANYLFAFTIPFTHIGGYLAAVAALFVSWKYFSRLKREPVAAALVCFLAYGFLRTVFSGHPDVGYACMVGYTGHWLLPFILGYTAGTGTAKKSVAIFYGVFTLLIALSLLAYTDLFWKHIGSFILVEDNLLKGLRSHIALGAICLLLTHISLNQALSKTAMPAVQRRLWFAGAAFFAVSLALTGSRGYYIAAAVSLGLFALVRLDRKTLLAGAAAAVVLAALAYGFVPQVKARISGTRVSENNVSERLSLYRVGMAEFKASPLFGFGPGQGTLQTSFFSILPPEQRRVQRHGHLHSLYVQLAADLGTAGLLLFGWIAVAALAGLRKGWQHPDPFTAALAVGVFWGLAGILTGDCFDTLLRGPGTAMEIFWLLGLVRGAQRDHV